TFVQGDSLVVRVKPDVGVVQASTLHVDVSNDVVEGLDVSGGSHVTATVTPTDMLFVSASGGSQADVTGISSSSLDLDASGGSGVTLQGSATRATASASGGSHIDLTGVVLDTLNLDASGGSGVRATVAKSVTGDASGGSTV